MKTLFKTALRTFTALAICAALSACSQPIASATSGFPIYGNQAAASGQFVAPTIMDY